MQSLSSLGLTSLARRLPVEAHAATRLAVEGDEAKCLAHRCGGWAAADEPAAHSSLRSHCSCLHLEEVLAGLVGSYVGSLPPPCRLDLGVPTLAHVCTPQGGNAADDAAQRFHAAT